MFTFWFPPPSLLLPTAYLRFSFFSPSSVLLLPLNHLLVLSGSLLLTY
jgi:hypothetical protein